MRLAEAKGSQVNADLPLRLVVAYDLGKDLISPAQNCNLELVVIKIDKERLITRVGRDCVHDLRE
jgi:hypothetical protein